MSGTSMGRFAVSFVGNSLVDGRTVYTIKVTNTDGETYTIQKRYKEIRELHDSLRFRHGDDLPTIPGKRLFGNQDPAFVAARQQGLQDYLEAVLRLEPDARSPALSHFLADPQPQAERCQSRCYQQILDNMQGKLLNLALPPAPLDETEMSLRLKKYGTAMRLHVLSQPADPIYLRALGFEAEPVPLCATNAERFEVLCAPPTQSSACAGDKQVMSDILSGIRAVLRPEKPIADPDRLIVPFPHVALPTPS